MISRTTNLVMEQHQSAQVWKCNTCGVHDNKTCGCVGATATSEALAAKKEANRQASRKSYEKAKQNQRASKNETDVDSVEESKPAESETMTDIVDISTRARKALYAAEEDKASEVAKPSVEVIGEAPKASFFLPNPIVAAWKSASNKHKTEFVAAHKEDIRLFWRD